MKVLTMKKIILPFLFLFSLLGWSQVKMPLPPNVAQFKSFQVTDYNYELFPRDGKYFILSDSCSMDEWQICDSSYFSGVLPGYDNALIGTREIYSLIEYYRKKLNIPKEVNFFNPTFITGEEFFKQMVDKSYFLANNKAFNSRERFHEVLRNPEFTILGYYELVPNRLKLYFGWSLHEVQYNLIDANKFR
jgi:hypothetical protein